MICHETDSGQSKPTDPSKDHMEHFQYSTGDGYLRTLSTDKRWVESYLFIQTEFSYRVWEKKINIYLFIHSFYK